jgi:hypothetical protein
MHSMYRQQCVSADANSAGSNVCMCMEMGKCCGPSLLSALLERSGGHNRYMRPWIPHMSSRIADLSFKLRRPQLLFICSPRNGYFPEQMGSAEVGFLGIQ